MSEDVSRICDIIAHDLARTHVSYYSDNAKRIKRMFRQRIQKACGHTAHRGWARLLLNRARDLITHGPVHRGANGAAMPTDEDNQDGHFSTTTPRGLLGSAPGPPRRTGLGYLSSSRALTRAFKCRGWRAPSR